MYDFLCFRALDSKKCSKELLMIDTNLGGGW